MSLIKTKMLLGDNPSKDSFKGKVLSVTKVLKQQSPVESILIIINIHIEVIVKKTINRNISQLQILKYLIKKMM